MQLKLGNNVLGITSAVLGIIVLVLGVGLMSSNDLNDGSSGILNYLLSSIHGALFHKDIPIEVTMSSPSTFPIDEKTERYIIGILTVVLAILSFLLATVAEMKNEYSLYSGIGVLMSFGGLVVVNPYIAVISIGLIFFIIFRKQKNGIVK